MTLDEAQERIDILENQLGCARHKAAVATIGYDQLNRMIAIFARAGYKGHLEEQARLCVDEVLRLRGAP